MESAIPSHLRKTGACPRRGYEAFSPPYPSFVARYPEAVDKVVMAYFGIQFRSERLDRAQAALARLHKAIGDPNGPRHHDCARYVDEAGFDTIVTAAYWTGTAEFDLWFPSAKGVWTGDDHQEEGIGTFIEVIRPRSDSYETLFSSLGRPEGVGVLAPSFSGEIREHAYWGGMRDRLPRSYHGPLEPFGPISMWRDGPRIRVQANDNLCLIRSGQDWTDTTQNERDLYIADVEPVLRAGMDFLRDDGFAIGCFANRYMALTDAAGMPIEKSYGLSWWRGLSDLERWAESHPTHVRIFGAAMKYLSALGPAAKLRLYHEVTVVAADEQYFEYLNCHSQTGLLRALT